jgi:hypothetical protein
MGEAIGVRMMVALTSRGFGAQQAVDLVNEMRGSLELAAQGYAPWIGIARMADSEKLEFRELKSTGTVMDNLGWFSDPLVIAIDLNSISLEVFFTLRAANGDSA